MLFRSEEAERDFSFLQDLVRQIRTIRSECTIPPDRKIKVLVHCEREKFLEENTSLVKLLAGIGEYKITGDQPGGDKPTGSIGLAGKGF